MPEYQEPTPMTPPSIRAQQTGQIPDVAAMMRLGQQARQPAGSGSEQVSLLAQKIDQLEVLVGEINDIVNVVHPPMGAYILPIAEAGKRLKRGAQELVQRAGGGPTAVGAMPQPPPNPTEGVSPRPM